MTTINKEASSGRINIVGRVENAVFVIGNKSKFARLLGVNPSQPTKWISGKENPSPQNMREIIDLDYVIARAGLLWVPSVIAQWLASSNAFLGGSRPIDVIKTEGATRVIEAINQELSGAYA